MSGFYAPAPAIFPYLNSEDAGYNTNNKGTSITPNAAANTKGGYTTLIAATTRQTRLMDICVVANPTGANSRSYLVDIATGAASSEVVLVPNICVDAVQQFGNTIVSFRLPINVPAGTRLSARCQTQAASGEACFVKIRLEDGTVGLTGVDSISASTATSLGPVLTPGNAADSAYIVLTASTARDYKGFFVIFDKQITAGSNFPAIAFDFAAGATGSEVEFYSNFQTVDTTGNGLRITNTPFVPYSIAAGTQLNVRARGSGASNIVGVSFYGVY